MRWKRIELLEKKEAGPGTGSRRVRRDADEIRRPSMAEHPQAAVAEFSAARRGRSRMWTTPGILATFGIPGCGADIPIDTIGMPVHGPGNCGPLKTPNRGVMEQQP